MTISSERSNVEKNFTAEKCRWMVTPVCVCVHLYVFLHTILFMCLCLRQVFLLAWYQVVKMGSLADQYIRGHMFLPPCFCNYKHYITMPSLFSCFFACLFVLMRVYDIEVGLLCKQSKHVSICTLTRPASWYCMVFFLLFAFWVYNTGSCFCCTLQSHFYK